MIGRLIGVRTITARRTKRGGQTSGLMRDQRFRGKRLLALVFRQWRWEMAGFIPRGMRIITTRSSVSTLIRERKSGSIVTRPISGPSTTKAAPRVRRQLMADGFIGRANGATFSLSMLALG